eukprot:s477_g10.t3
MFHLERLGGASEAADDYGHTGLHHAAMQGHAAVCQALLEHPRFIGEGAKDKEGWTAFHWAVFWQEMVGSFWRGESKHGKTW